MTISILGLSISFVILAALLLWVCVDKNVSKVIKALMIAGVLWFGLVLLYTPSNMMGWPISTTYDGLPDMGVVLSWKVIQPNINGPEAGIYIWMVPKEEGAPEKSLFEIILLDPRYAFKYTLKDTPRCYKLPYEKEEHRRLSKKAAKARKLKGALIFKRGPRERGKSKRQGQGYKDDSGWKVLDPEEIMKKAQED